MYKITGTSPEMMQIIIDYAYTGTAPLTAANVGALLMAADQFHVTGIIRLCCEFLRSQLSPDNCIGIWRLTDRYYCPELREAACLFILHHFQEVSRVSAEFLELPVSHLKDIIEKDELIVREEGAVFEAVLKWIAHDPQSRRQHTAVLLGRVGAVPVCGRGRLCGAGHRAAEPELLGFLWDQRKLEPPNAAHTAMSLQSVGLSLCWGMEEDPELGLGQTL